MAKIAWITRMMSYLVGSFVLMASADYAIAQSASSDVLPGREIAVRLCSECHVVGSSDETGWTNAPTFVQIANRRETTEAKLKSFIQQPHVDMLNSARPPREAVALAAYIMSLRKN
jgi:cytochrome c2